MSNNRTIRPTMSFCELAVVTATCPRAVGNRALRRNYRTSLSQELVVRMIFVINVFRRQGCPHLGQGHGPIVSSRISRQGRSISYIYDI